MTSSKKRRSASRGRPPRTGVSVYARASEPICPYGTGRTVWCVPERLLPVGVSLRRKPWDAEFSGGRASGSSSGRAARGCGRNCAGSAYNKGPPCCGNRACTPGGGEFLPVVLDLYDRKIIRGTSRPSTPRPPPTARPYRLYTSSSPDQGKQVR